MKTIQIPYYTSTMDLHVEEENLKAVIYSGTDEYKTDKTEAELVEEALRNPIGTPPLRELAKGKKKIVLITSDHTRAVPSKLTLPILLREIREGNPEADITILIATGLHRKTTEEEQRRMFGDAIVDNEKIVVNEAFKQEDFDFVCGLPSGAELWVNKLATHCDLLISEGFIEPHFFAGFSGGRKSVLPGICNAATVNENHSYKAIASPFSTTGVLKHNPIHEDMVYAARSVHLAFILNGFDYHGLTMGGAAVWLCLGVPLAPVFVLKFGRLELYEHPVIRYCTDDGRRKRHRAPKKPWKARWRDIWDTVKVFVFSPLIFAILFVLIVLVVNTVLVLHWDSF